MTMKEAVTSAFQKYCCFEGRARRSEYWYFYLFRLIVSACLTIALNRTGIRLFNTLNAVFALAVLLPGLGLTWRRLHDVGKSGAYVFMVLIPLVGAILVLVKLCTDSRPGDNLYGPNPKGFGTQQNYSDPYPIYTVPGQTVPQREPQKPYSVEEDAAPFTDRPAPDYRTYAAPAADAWTCRSCGAPVTGGKFCPNCGSGRPERRQQLRCAHCGYVPAEGEKTPRFCPNCGNPF